MQSGTRANARSIRRRSVGVRRYAGSFLLDRSSWPLSASIASVAAWPFNIAGFADLLHAYCEGLIDVGFPPGSLGAAVHIPTVFAPLLLVTHVMMFRLLLGATRVRNEIHSHGA